MTADLKPYPHYKPSGVEWIGDVPAHWDVRRLKNICRLAYGDSLSSENRINGPVPVYGSNGQVGVHSTSNTAGQCLIVGRKGSFGKVHYSAKPVFAIDTTFFVDRRHTGANIRWLYYLLGWLHLDAVSKDLAIPGLNREDAYQHIGCYPPLAEQAAIVRYLDHTDGRIRRYLRSRERLLELLKEYRQAVIHETVTQGLDPDVPLKPSGAEWLGDIPAHWEVRRVKYAFRRIVGGSTPSSSEAAYWDGTIVWVTPTDVSKVTRLRDSQRRITKKGFDSCSTTLVPVGSLVVTSRAPVGNVALAEVPLCTNQGCKTLVPDSQVMDSTYGYQVFGRLKDELQSLANGTTFTEISTNALGNVLLPIPPLAEQAAIAAYLDKQTAAIAAAMARAQREIDLLSEYRTRLIADVVTGQVDVREEGT